MSFDLTTAVEDTEYKGNFDLSSATEDLEYNTNAETAKSYILPYKHNAIDGLKDAWDFVTQVPVAAFMEQKKDNEAARTKNKRNAFKKNRQ